MASKAFGNVQKSIKDQASRREVMTFYDQHKSARFPNGRPWWGHIEMPSEVGAPWGVVGSLNPGDHNDPFGSAWEAPWMPPEKYIKSNVDTGRVQILYVPMIAEYRERTNAYYAECGEKAFEKGWPAPEPGGIVPWRLRIIAGPIPQSPQIPTAAQAGDPWILGFQSEPNDALQRVLKATAYSDRQVSDGSLDAPNEVAPTPLPGLIQLSQADLATLISVSVAEAMNAAQEKTTRANKAQKAVEAYAAQAEAAPTP